MPPAPEQRKPLPSGTRLDYYTLHKLIGSGGFSLIYLGEEDDSHDEVAIKEYLPKRFAQRDEEGVITFPSDEAKDKFYRGLKLFFLEAKALATLRHPNIVNVRNCFLANGTAYLVMDYEPGKNLGRYIKRRKGGLSTRFLMTVFPPLLDALALIHESQHLHLDIKPSNIHIRPGGSPLLLDFGAVYHLSGEDQKKAQVITPGFSPIEQYRGVSKVGPWTDVYAIGASMRTCIEGRPPPSATERHAKDTMVPAVEAFGKRYPRHILQAIDRAMEIDPQKRIQSAALLLKELTRDPASRRRQVRR
ncbi:MAG TPA: serine/threonine protein kinase [Thiolapillus brandeum]|uniref:non-specific serine/threonine protein kinase n=1 Tax=Thiolapillus brandeum TaxID=1076588 RepID=A0A7C5IYF9_9GAMM|nr:serine/threonine protein kinase [Thiolapillus brandeum]